MPPGRKRRHINYTERGAMSAAWDGRCAYCGTRERHLEAEHVEAVSRGGDDSPENLVPACMRCNTRKSNLFLLEWALVEHGFWHRTKPSFRFCRVATDDEMRAESPAQRLARMDEYRRGWAERRAKKRLRAA